MPIAEWEQEYADLKTQRDSDYTKLKDTRAEVAELQKIRKCVDIALRADQPEQTQSRTKRHEQYRPLKGGATFMYYTQEQIDRANQADLVSFLQSQGEQLTRAGHEYRWKRHDSLTVRGNKWYRHSQSKGGGPVDFVMEFFGKSFTEAVELLTGEKGAAPPPDRPSPAPLSDFRLPPRSTDNRIARNYLTAARRIDEDVTGFFFSTGDIYEEAAHHNAVFVGRDESGIPRYAHQRGTAGSFRLDVKGSDKAFNFCYRGEGERLFVFEAPIDLLSFLCLFKKDWQKQSYLSLGGVGEKALLRFPL